MITLREVAERAGVSPATVSFVLNNRRLSRISDETRERVRAVAEELGYVPNRIAKALATGRTETIGLWIRSMHSTYYTQFIHDIDDVVARGGYRLMINRNAGASARTPEAEEFPIDSADGIFAIDIPGTVDQFLTKHPSVPVVQVGTHFSDRTDYVGVELRTATRDALLHLYSLGRRRIGYLMDSLTYDYGGDHRLRIYRSTMEELNLPVTMILARNQSYDAARVAVQDLFASGKPPVDAIACYNDDLAVATLRVLHEKGVAIPEDIAVVGCDNISVAEHLWPSLSTIVHPWHEVCVLGWQFLLHRIKNPDIPPQRIELSARFEPRGSTVADRS